MQATGFVLIVIAGLAFLGWLVAVVLFSAVNDLKARLKDLETALDIKTRAIWWILGPILEEREQARRHCTNSVRREHEQTPDGRSIDDRVTTNPPGAQQSTQEP